MPSFGPIPLTEINFKKQLAFACGLETEKLQRIFAHVSVDTKLNSRTEIFEVVKSRERNGDFIADAADVDNHGSRLFGKQCAAEMRNHSGGIVAEPSAVAQGRYSNLSLK